MAASVGLARASVLIPEDKLVRVLVIDDEKDFHERMTDYFALYGYQVDCAESIAKGEELLAQHEYQIVLVDVNFPGQRQKGDRFVLENHESFKKARVVIVTGLNVNELRHSAALKSLRIPIWSKGAEDFGKYLTELTKSAKAARKRELPTELNELLIDKFGTGNYVMTTTATAAAPALERQVSAPAWALAVEDILIGWLEGLSNRERPFLAIGARMLSANKMIDEVKEKTDIGRELLDMFVTEVRHSLHLKGKLNS